MLSLLLTVSTITEMVSSLAEAVAMATDRPAKAVGRDKQIGQLTVGYPAFFSVFTDEVTDAKSLCFYPEK